MTPSIQSALKDLNLDQVFVVYPGNQNYLINKHVEALPLRECITRLISLK